MKVIFTVASMAGGGAERVISILANRFASKGHQVKIVMLAGDRVDYLMDDQIEITSIGGTAGGSMKKRIKRLITLRKIFKRNSEAVVITFGLGSSFYSATALLGLKNPLIISERNDPAACPHPYLRNIVFAQADKLVFQTEDAAMCFPKKLQMRGKVIPNPISGQIMDPYTGERQKFIAAVGRLEPQKNYPMMIRAFASFHESHPEYKLRIWGRGYLEEELKLLVRQLNMQEAVFMEGFSSQVHECIKNASMYVLSSDYEGISNALLEAMALGLPVISTDCPIGGSKLCINDGQNGLLTPVGDCDAMARAMERFANDPAKASEMGQEAVKVRERFSEMSIADIWEKVIKDVI